MMAENDKCIECGHMRRNHNPANRKGLCAGGGCHCPIFQEDWGSFKPTIDCPCQTWASTGEFPHNNGHHPSCDGKGGHKDGVFKESELAVEAFAVTSPAYDYISHDKPEPSLSLLIVDFGNCCVVKVERGEMSAMFAVEGRGYHFTGLERVKYLPHSFTAVREAIDSQDKPVPRIEKRGDAPLLANNAPYYRLFVVGCEQDITGGQYKGLSALAGKPLPIYTPTEGEWELLTTETTFARLPMNVYRYTR